MLFRRKRYPYAVTVHLNGRHPYLKSTELDYPSRDVVLTVNARNWNDAAKQALDAASTIQNKWSWCVVSVARRALSEQEKPE